MKEKGKKKEMYIFFSYFFLIGIKRTVKTKKLRPDCCFGVCVSINDKVHKLVQRQLVVCEKGIMLSEFVFVSVEWFDFNITIPTLLCSNNHSTLSLLRRETFSSFITPLNKEMVKRQCIYMVDGLFYKTISL
jgi:hypothetical protein